MSATADEWVNKGPSVISDTQRLALQEEITDLEQYADLATSIEHNARGEALLKVLEKAFAETLRLGGARKTIILKDTNAANSL